MRIGSILVKIKSGQPRYAKLLAWAYSTSTLIDPPQSINERIDFEVYITESFTKWDDSETDRITMNRVDHGYEILTDPIQCKVNEQQAGSVAKTIKVEFMVSQAQMIEEHLAYHMYLIMNRILLLYNNLLVHAAAIDINHQINIFCGHKGSGKSTLSLFLAKSGARILAEDRIVIRNTGRQYLVSGCSSMMKIMSKSEDFLIPKQLKQKHVLVSGIPKKVFDGSSMFNMTPHQDLDPKRIFFNSLGSEFECGPISANQALALMVDRTGSMYRFSTREDYSIFFGFIASFIKSVDCYSLKLSPNLEDLSLVSKCIEQLGKT